MNDITATESKPQILSLGTDDFIAYNRLIGSGAGIIFCGGFKSDMTGSKAVALEEACRAAGRPFVRFDYRGHGASSDKFENGAIGDWYSDALHVFDKLTEGPQVVVGSSMGGWIALKIAIARPERVKALVGVASAPDFTEHLIWDKLDDAARSKIMEEGRYDLPSDYCEGCYPITRRLIEEAREHMLLDKLSIPVRCPVTLLHGTADDDVPYEFSLRISEKLESDNVKVILVKGGNHRLSEPDELELICAESLREF